MCLEVRSAPWKHRFHPDSVKICKPNVLRAIFNWQPVDICYQFVDVCSLVLFISLLCNTKPMDCNTYEDVQLFSSCHQLE